MQLHTVNTSDNLSADLQIVLLPDYLKSLSNSSFILSMYGTVKAGGWYLLQSSYVYVIALYMPVKADVVT